MGKLILALATGLIGAAIVHIAVIFLMPAVAQDSAWNKLARLSPPEVTVTIDTGPQSAFALMDPAFRVSACRFDLTDGPIRVEAAAQPAFWSASVFSRAGDNLYSINQRAALDDRLDLVIGTQAQFEALRIGGEFEEGASIFVPFDASEGYALLRGLVESPSLAPLMDSFVQTLRCTAIPLPDPQ
ncbi:DUF1254 domain-containing protein [Aureimonas frigidaquae]|uniref:DUF1254 domain-containing protein n=1 Tax=Aureimonas frigidaquae TaxID=424757 RepID=UPI0007848A6D|nr:hypothetical protein [Aureimonas frigidaquae]